MIWYEEEVCKLEKVKEGLTYEPETIFYGSSTIRLWETLYEDFKELKPVNLGFGGSTLAACDWFFNRILQPYQAKRIIFYAGDNDLGDGRNPEEVFIFYQQLQALINKRFPAIQFYFISIKPSIARWSIIEKIKHLNLLVQEDIAKGFGNQHFIDIFTHMLNDAGMPDASLFEPDGLHLSKKGYQLWIEQVKRAL